MALSNIQTQPHSKSRKNLPTWLRFEEDWESSMFQLCFGNNPNGSDGLVLTASSPRKVRPNFQEFKTWSSKQAVAKHALIREQFVEELASCKSSTKSNVTVTSNNNIDQPLTATGQSKLPHCTLPAAPHRCVLWIPSLDPSHPPKLLPQHVDLRLQELRRTGKKHV